VAAVYFHYPCFDGLVSAAIARSFLEGSCGWEIERFEPVNYDLIKTWLQTRLDEPAAIVDFLYHPDAVFWADHHATTFLTDEARRDFETRRSDRILLYDGRCSSCALVLMDHLAEQLRDRERYAEMARWADKVDSAGYSSVEEAIFGSAPALRINLSLSDESAKAETYWSMLLESMRAMTLEEIAALPEVERHANAVLNRTRRGIDEVAKTIKTEPGEIAVFEAHQNVERIVNRYSPYVFFPEARYSVGLVRSADGDKITAMRNPWRDFESVELGDLMRKYGGGGHRRVGSVMIPAGKAPDAAKTLSAVVAEIRRLDGAAIETARSKA